MLPEEVFFVVFYILRLILNYIAMFVFGVFVEQ